MIRFFRNLLLGLLAILALGPPLLLGLYALVPVPVTPLMVIRLAEGEGLDKDWVGREAISPEIMRAVIAAEDGKFCSHNGFDWDAIDNAIDEYESGGKVLGASTISMQTAKNLFLWPGRDFLRKGLEAYLTVWLELLWDKPRILTTYLNIIEWGPGLYGIEAASRTYFGKPARSLSRTEAALLASVLPNPRRWSPAKPTAYIARRAHIIAGRMNAAPIDGRSICGG